MSDCLVSICVTTFNRPELLSFCIDTCLSQTHRNIEILVGDDSPNDNTEILLQKKYGGEPRIKYVHNRPALGQANNTSSLFSLAQGDKILLMHDDDFLVDGAIEHLLSFWNLYPDLDVAFGDQYEVSEAGDIDIVASERLNAMYHRTRMAEGLQHSPGVVGISQMFPNNGWMVNADLVKQIDYKAVFGAGCEFVFGVQVCMASKRIYYSNRYTSSYRRTGTSISQSERNGSITSAPVQAFKFLSTLNVPAELQPAKRGTISRLVPMVVSTYAKTGFPIKSVRIALTHPYSYRYGLSLRLYYHLMLAMRSMLSMSNASTMVKTQ